jgi:hypothetical protein
MIERFPGWGSQSTCALVVIRRKLHAKPRSFQAPSLARSLQLKFCHRQRDLSLLDDEESANNCKRYRLELEARWKQLQHLKDVYTQAKPYSSDGGSGGLS